MKAHEFTIVATGLNPNDEDFENRLFEAGCGDAAVSYQKGVIILEFSREAQTFASALVSACEDVNRAGAKVERIEPDHLVSLSEIAARSGLTRAAVSHYCKGIRGAGFPAPVARVTSESPLWDWVDVSRWMCERQQLPGDTVLQARMVREANIVAEMRLLPRGQFVKTLAKRMKNLEAA